MLDRIFTPAEANSALPEVRDVAVRLVTLRARMRELDKSQTDLVLAIGGNGGGYAAGDLNEARTELQTLATQVAACLELLDSLGVQVKDPDAGLLDFPSQRGGEPVLLCWLVGEDEVAYWHDHASGFAGRSPIDWED